jgi:hypothetical protein
MQIRKFRQHHLQISVHNIFYIFYAHTTQLDMFFAKQLPKTQNLQPFLSHYDKQWRKQGTRTNGNRGARNDANRAPPTTATSSTTKAAPTISKTLIDQIMYF